MAFKLRSYLYKDIFLLFKTKLNGGEFWSRSAIFISYFIIIRRFSLWFFKNRILLPLIKVKCFLHACFMLLISRIIYRRFVPLHSLLNKQNYNYTVFKLFKKSVSFFPTVHFCDKIGLLASNWWYYVIVRFCTASL